MFLPDMLRRFETPGALAGQIFGGEEQKSVVKIDNPKPFTVTSSGPLLAIEEDVHSNPDEAVIAHDDLEHLRQNSATFFDFSNLFVQKAVIAIVTRSKWKNMMNRRMEPNFR
ncbi:hypothetical protein F4861DRAFT_544620 [Xylaria intraflava]|nr:hypothetical protein F4861DRAFT_544620 [Xylaria intraflava]